MQGFRCSRVPRYVIVVSAIVFLLQAQQANAITGSATCTTPKAGYNATVSFSGGATNLPCDKTISDVSWSWSFGDGGTSSSQNPTHTYSQANAGVKTATLTVSCAGQSDSDSCTVYVVADVIIDTITSRPSNKISFNNKNEVKGHLMPTSIQSAFEDDIIDWEMDDVIRADCYLVNADEGNLAWTANWPTSNSDWGSGDALIACINKWDDADEGDFHQTDDLDTVGPIQASINISKFFNRDGTENPDTGNLPNWYYYWSQTSANAGTHSYSAGTSYEHWDGGWCVVLGDDCVGAYTPPDGDNAGEELENIDNFAWTARHENRHLANDTNWWPTDQYATGDNDSDQLPDNQESTLGGTQQNPVNGGPFASGNDDTNSDGYIDGENYTMHTQASWTEFDAQSEDWAYPGTQEFN